MCSYIPAVTGCNHTFPPHIVAAKGRERKKERPARIILKKKKKTIHRRRCRRGCSLELTLLLHHHLRRCVFEPTTYTVSPIATLYAYYYDRSVLLLRTRHIIPQFIYFTMLVRPSPCCHLILPWSVCIWPLNFRMHCMRQADVHCPKMFCLVCVLYSQLSENWVLARPWKVGLYSSSFLPELWQGGLWINI